MFSEAIQNPLLMDRYLSLKATKYVFGTARHLADEITFKPGGRIEERAKRVLAEAHEMLEGVASKGIWEAIAKGEFADVKRTKTGGKGYAGVVERKKQYVNPLLAELEKAGVTTAQGLGA
jgi:beta-lysine 5,6-aminomutase alpha subunit